MLRLTWCVTVHSVVLVRDAVMFCDEMITFEQY